MSPINILLSKHNRTRVKDCGSKSCAGLWCGDISLANFMNSPPFAIPADIILWIRTVFAEMNQRASAKLSRIPNIHETSLDMTLIEQLSHYAAPVRFPSDWLLRLDTHYLGGPRYWGRWEIADIGILVAFRRGGIVQQTKVALLQSKRLYPEEVEAPAEDHPVDYEVGFARLLETEQEFRSVTKNRKFTFTRNSRYRAFDYHGEQYDAILKYMTDTAIPVHYLFHNPLTLPSTAVLPVIAKEEELDAHSCEVGCRVVRAQVVDGRLKPPS